MRATINTALSRRTNLLIDIDQIDAELIGRQQEQQDINEMLDIARKAARLVQDELAGKLSTIVTKAIATVFEEPLEFVCEFVERRGVSEADLYVKDADGHTYDILSGRGGGLADVCSTSLQMAFIMLSDVDRYLIADEIARHLSTGHQERFAEVLKLLCSEFGFTIVMTTHSQALAEAADKLFQVSIKNNTSKVKEITHGHSGN